jgi:hypothetical protein
MKPSLLASPLQQAEREEGAKRQSNMQHKELRPPENERTQGT